MKLRIVITLSLLLNPLLSLTALDLDKIIIPKGFKIELYAEGLKAPRGLTVNDDDTLYVGSKSGFLYKITSDKKISVIKEGLNGTYRSRFSQREFICI